MILPRSLGPALCLLLAAALSRAGAAALPSRNYDLAVFFAPFKVEQIALSPDGKHLAFAERTGDRLSLALLDLDTNAVKRMFLAADDFEPMSSNKFKTPARLTFLGWANADRLVFNLQSRIVWSVDAQGQNPRQLIDSAEFDNAISNRRFASVPGSKSSGAMRSGGNPWRGAGPRLTVTALPPNEPFVYIEGQRTIAKIDVGTGEIDDDNDSANIARVSLLLSDQQGQPRIGLSTDRLEAQYTYEYQTAGGSSWKPLDTVLGRDSALAFRYDEKNYLGHRSIPLAFDLNANLLYYASNLGRDTFGIYALDLKTKKPTAAAIEFPTADLIDPFARKHDNLVFDPWKRTLVGVRITALQRETLWLQPDLAKVQAALSRAAPQKTMEIVEWDAARRRFLVLGWTNSDPGSYYIFDRATNALEERVKRAPDLPDTRIGTTDSFEFDTPAGVHLTGYLTRPSIARIKSPPLLVLCQDGLWPWNRDFPGFNRQVQALASMGFAILQVNHRGSRGFGVKHLEAVRGGFDARPLEDIDAAIDWAVKTHGVNRKLVGMIGTGYGGYLALRALQLQPERFRCAVAIDAPTDLDLWLSPGKSGYTIDKRVAGSLVGADPAVRKALSPLTQPELITQPVLIIQSESNSDVPTVHGRDLRDALVKCGQTPEYIQLNHTPRSSLPGEQGELFGRIEEFLNLNVYDYAVKSGEAVRVGVE